MRLGGHPDGHQRERAEPDQIDGDSPNPTVCPFQQRDANEQPNWLLLFDLDDPSNRSVAWGGSFAAIQLGFVRSLGTQN
jgi:hypothetical protein